MSDLPTPVISDINRPFWERGRQNELVLQRCTACSHLRYPISSICPRCLDSSWSWDPVSGRGEALSVATFHRVYHPSREDRVPYAVALVQLDEGPRMISDLVGDGALATAVGDRLAVAFDQDPDGRWAIPRFQPDLPGRQR